MSEARLATGVVGLTTYRNKLVLSSLQAEDAGKSERAIENSRCEPVHESMLALAEGMLGLWSGKVEATDGESIQTAVPMAFRREFAEETATDNMPGIVLHPEQLQGQPLYAGRIEQIRPPVGRVLFWVYALPMVEFTWEQVNRLAKQQKPGQELWEMAVDQAAEQLQHNWQSVRPATRIAIQALLAYSERPTQVW